MNATLEAKIVAEISQAENAEQWDTLQTLIDISWEIRTLSALLTLALPYVEEGEEYQKTKDLSKRIRKAIQ